MKKSSHSMYYMYDVSKYTSLYRGWLVGWLVGQVFMAYQPL